jgi:hypothetical protein
LTFFGRRRRAGAGGARLAGAQTRRGRDPGASSLEQLRHKVAAADLELSDDETDELTGESDRFTRSPCRLPGSPCYAPAVPRPDVGMASAAINRAPT